MRRSSLFLQSLALNTRFVDIQNKMDELQNLLSMIQKKLKDNPYHPGIIEEAESEYQALLQQQRKNVVNKLSVQS